MKADELRKSILQLAIQGKLVKQNPDDEPASVLLEKIREEKKRLVKEGKTKKDKTDSFIYRGADNSHYEKIENEVRCIDEEIPFEIPESWVWCRLEDVVDKLTDGTHKTPYYTSTGVPFLSVKDISSGKISFDNAKLISEKEHSELYRRCNPQKGDILLTKVGTTGIPVLIDTDKEFSLFVSVALIKYKKGIINDRFFISLLQSPLVAKQCAENTKGVGNKNWVMRDIANTLITLPPLSEQQRIVKQLEIFDPFFALYEKYEQQESKLTDEFPDKLKKSILQFAIQGKLVAQNSKDESASVLLEKIRN
jgi:type I restriction enzyme S subunit